MITYRLTEKQESNLNLIPVTWATVLAKEIKQIYIKAHPHSSTYGPYLVKDARDCLVCRLDGTEPRYYSRDKGLFVSRAMSGKPVFKSLGHLDPTRAVLESMVTEMSRDIIKKQQELKILQTRHGVLTEILKQG